MRRFIALAAFFALGGSVQAADLIPAGGESIELGSIRGVTYYTEAEDGYRVVTTLADGEAGLPVRFELILADKQRFAISVPGKLGERIQVVEISRTGDKISLTGASASDKLVAK